MFIVIYLVFRTVVLFYLVGVFFYYVFFLLCLRVFWLIVFVYNFCVFCFIEVVGGIYMFFVFGKRSLFFGKSKNVKKKLLLYKNIGFIIVDVYYY